MKLLGKAPKKDTDGTVKLVAEEGKHCTVVRRGHLRVTLSPWSAPDGKLPAKEKLYLEARFTNRRRLVACLQLDTKGGSRDSIHLQKGYQGHGQRAAVREGQNQAHHRGGGHRF